MHFFFSFFVPVVGIKKPRAFLMLAKHAATELHHQPFKNDTHFFAVLVIIPRALCTLSK
jgi:Ni,Fe-hydrogenase I cytochrome b subunit